VRLDQQNEVAIVRVHEIILHFLWEWFNEML